MRAIVLIIATLLPVVLGGALAASTDGYNYDGDGAYGYRDMSIATGTLAEQRDRPQARADRSFGRGYDDPGNLARASAPFDGYRSAPQTAGGVPSVVFSRSRAPGVAQNFDDAVAHGAPTRLTRVDAATRDANRRAALRGQSPAPAGQSLDEYPFACSAQGGCGAFVRSVPVGEQSYQGGVLSRFFQDFGIRPGDPFDVMFGP